jgi:hypothetical protein
MTLQFVYLDPPSPSHPSSPSRGRGEVGGHGGGGWARLWARLRMGMVTVGRV